MGVEAEVERVEKPRPASDDGEDQAGEDDAGSVPSH